MKALVTGSSGFVGRHMCAELKARGYEVIGIDLRGDGNAGHTTHQMDAVTYFRNERLLTYKKDKFDLVVHCAYHVGGRIMIDGVPDVLSANEELDASLFRWALHVRPQRILYFSSSAVYPICLQGADYPYLFEQKDRRLTENSVQLSGLFGEPDARYGWAKLNGEKLVAAARESGLLVSVVRPFSGYAEDQSLDYPFPSIIQRASQGDLTVWGPPGQIRDWIHISDVIRGSLAVVDSGTTDPVNICTGIGTEMGALAKKVWDTVNPPSGMHVNIALSPTYLVDKPTGVHFRVGNPTNMLQYYTPQVTLEEGIRRALGI